MKSQTMTLFAMKFVMAISLIISASLAHAECPSVSKDAEELIIGHTQEVRGGEYCRFRKVYKRNGIELVLYTIEGPCYKNSSRAGSCGNHYFRSMVGVINGKKYQPIVIGGKGVFQSKEINYSEGVVTINGLSYKRSDPMCCPSVEDQRKYKIGALEFEKVEP